MRLKLFLVFAFFCQIFTGVAQTRAYKNINYANNTSEANTLNIYARTSTKQAQDVIVFIHGGSWSSGKKETYWWLGRNLAKKGVVSVITNYPLAPNATYKEMALAAAKAVKWVRDSIASYGGNPGRIFLMGHSAGAHLCELINADTQYFRSVGMVNPIKGVILNDPFGLDMEEYLTKAKRDDYYTDFIRTFSAEPKNWQLGSPLFYLENIQRPHLIFYGTKTYDAIQLQSERTYKALKAKGVPVTLKVVEGKKHVAMISQMIWGKNKLYADILDFLRQTERVN